MQLIGRFLVGLGNPRGVRVRIDRLLPVANAREDVRGHVQGVRRIGRHLRVAPCGRQALLGQRRRVVEVNEIVRDTRMVWLPIPDLLEDRRTLELIGVGLVRW